MSIVIYKKWFFAFSSALVAASIGAIAFFGLRFGIDFLGGTLWQVRFEDTAVTKDAVTSFFHDELDRSDAAVILEGDGSFLVRTLEITEADHQAFSARLTTLGAFEDLRFESVGASIGAELRQRSLIAFGFVLLTISLYIAFVFRKVSYPVSSWKYGIVTLITLFHDAVIPVGLLAVLGRYAGVEVGVDAVVAILVIIGFSVHDTIVVFDRIREHLRLVRGGSDFAALVGQSIRETVARSINTSLTLVLVLIALLVAGAPTLRPFILTILVGTVVGTYSSICLASPFLISLQKGRRKA